MNLMRSATYDTHIIRYTYYTHMIIVNRDCKLIYEHLHGRDSQETVENTN